MADQSIYFAAEPEAKDAVQRIQERVKRFRGYLSRSGRADRMRRAWSAFYGNGPDGTKSSARLLRGGEQGELVLITPPIFPTLVRQVTRLLTGQKPAFKAIATNSDAATVQETILADQLIAAYDRRIDIEAKETSTVQAGTMLSSAFTGLEWATSEGAAIGADPDTGKVAHEGDVRAFELLPWDVAYDWRIKDDADREWIVFRRPQKRHKLAAQYPALADKILAGGKAKQVKDASNDAFECRGDSPWRFEDETVEDEDIVWLWEFRHVPCSQLPPGRLIRYLSADIVLYDSKDAGYPYCSPDEKKPDLLVYEFNPETVSGTSEGNTAAWDVLALQEALDMLLTVAVTNMNVGALANYWHPPGAAPSLQTLDTGLNLLESISKPELLDSVKLPQELLILFDLLKGLMRDSQGINEVASGDVPKGMPAQLAALLEQKAVQYHQVGQRAYYRLAENVRTGILKLLKRFVDSERVIEVVGKSQSWATKQFTGGDVAGVERISVEPVNPVMRTFAGRMTLAQDMAARGWIGKDEYLSVWTTGETHEIMDSRKANLGRISQEKELLAQGVGLPPVDMQASMQSGAPVFAPTQPNEQAIRPIMTDTHWVDIPEMLAVLANPDSRANPTTTQAVLDVVTEKLRLMRTMPPDLARLLGAPDWLVQQLMMAQQPPPMPPGPPGPHGGPPPPHPPMPPGKGPAAIAAPAGGPDVRMPSPPPTPDGQQGPPVT